MFQPTERIKVLKQERSQSATNGANKKAKVSSLSLFASIINPAKREWRRCTRPLSLRCTRCTRWATLPTVRIEITKAVTSLRVNIKPTRLTTPLRCMRSLSLRCALSLRDLLPLLREYTKSTGSLKTTKKLRLT